MGEVSDEPRDQSKTSTKTWSTMSTPHTALSPSRRNKMPRLFRAGHREDYPPEFLDTIERIDIICCSLKQLEKLGKAVRKDSNRKQKIWSKTAEALKVYADQMMTDEIAETFRRASTKFFEIGQLYLKHAEAIVVQFNPALREFNKVAAKEVQAHLKNLSKVRRNLDRTRKKAERRDDEETAAAVQAAQKDHDEKIRNVKRFFQIPSHNQGSHNKIFARDGFLQGAANAYLAMEKELCDKIYQELNSLRDEGSKQKKQKSGDSKSGEQKPDDQKHEDQKPEEDQKQEDQKEEDHKQKDHKQKDQKKDGHKPEEKKTGSQEPEEDHKQKDQKKDGHKPEEKKTGSQEPEEDHKQKDQKKDGQKPGGQKTGSQEPEDEKNS
ncbi:hypothetical protein ANCCEY_05339 [Ancylostoma ceylanicum]|uniref:BAR domain-containing protein n=1 Tax=Ancylostoma ceylanicum TaxID=53326 RepID=A0A0D6M6P7_9BILA|nr:hypothetical protein ANCCEY_05339 [Ancylostoma ceylanicum]